MGKSFFIGLGLSFLGATVCSAQTKWQAVAYSATTGQDGYAFDFDTQANAEAAALDACRQNAGPSDCTVVDAAPACLALTATSDGAVAAKQVSPDDKRTEVVDEKGRAQPVLRNVCQEKGRKAKNR